MFFFFFFFKQKTAYEMQRGLVGSEMCIRDRLQYRVKISIGTEESRQLDEGECASDLSESEHSSVCEADAVYDKDGLESLTAFLIKARNKAVSYTHLRAHETSLHLVCRLLLEKKKKKKHKLYHNLM
eukprot:TRINITY_DN17237_c0_g1_i3.p1 TRINITY_DN17237_c0_g1~~TRINITY_DN17237_c0_g1_i3.p1  ORF type:complete len:127 (-),score=53.44 TRINITY_DN17237_c0_g1_i3:69-449(-)